MKKFGWLILIFTISTPFSYGQSSKLKDIRLEAYKKIDKPARNEVSGMVKSRILEDTFWVHGDSGTENRIYAIDKNGKIKSESKKVFRNHNKWRRE